MVRQYHQCYGHEIEQTPRDSGGQGSLKGYIHGVTELGLTSRHNNNNNSQQVWEMLHTIPSFEDPKSMDLLYVCELPVS